MSSLVGQLLLFIVALVGIGIVMQSYRRSNRDVLVDLDDTFEGDGSSTIKIGERKIGGLCLSGRAGALGLFTREERRRLDLHQRLFPVVGSLIGISLRFLFEGATSTGFLIAALLGACIGMLMFRRHIATLRLSYKQSLEFFLPMVMERIVMAVSAGLDIVPAVKVVVELDELSGELQTNPVSRLLRTVYQLTESGLQFEDALRDVASSIDCSALRHAFIHLSIAGKEGGELVMPLRELSDSTQLYYQESVEEVIAKMPVKATMPLLLTFAGLIICFISIPLMQVLSITQKSRVHSEIQSER